MRGKLFFQDAGGMKPGNIPAYAGKTRRRRRGRQNREHPRVCGENEMMGYDAAFVTLWPQRKPQDIGTWE